MQFVQLFALQQGGTGYAGYRELDLYSSEPIKMSISVQGLEDPKATTSSFSRTFRVPHTTDNGKFFEGVFNVNGVDFNATEKALAYIMVNGLTFSEGNIRLQQVYRNDGTGKIEYEIIFFGETSTFGSIVAPKDLSTLDLSDFAHTLDYNAVVNSWTGNLFQGDIVYPLAEYGYDYATVGAAVPIQSTLSVWNGTTSTKGFTNSINPLNPNQFKPMVRVKAIWDRIFSEAGFTYESSFLDTALFQSLYMISSNTASALQVPSVRMEAPLTPYTWVPFTAPTQELQIDTPWIDRANSYVLPGKYKASYSGSPYEITLSQLWIEYGMYPTPCPFTGGDPSFSIKILVNGSLAASLPAYLQDVCSVTGLGGAVLASTVSPYDANQTDFVFNIPLSAGDIVEVAVSVPNSTFAAGNNTPAWSLQQGEIYVEGPLVVDPAGLLPVQFKQIDLIKAINDRFKLVWQPDPDNSRNFFIEPWKDWVIGGQQKDWSMKLDQSKDISITPLFYSQTREIIYKDAEEGDLYNFLFQQQNKETFGELKSDSNVQLLTGDKTISSLFASTPLAPIGNSGTFLIPHFAKDTETQRLPIQVKPRLLFYNGLQASPATWYMQSATGPVANNQYPLASQFDRYPFDNTAFDMNWANVPQFWDGDVLGFTGRTGKTAYTEYWSTWFNYTYSPYSRIMEATFSLDVADIQKLKFNDQIWVKDAWWMVQEIKDFVLNERQSCRVTLLKMGDFGFQQGATGAQGRNYIQTGLCYSSISACRACCCQEQTGVNVFSNSKFLSQSIQLFQDQAGLIFAQPGYYSDGTNYYVVGNFGNITSSGVCSCSCTPTGLTTISNICEGPTLCNVCCCTVSEIGAIYVNGSSMGTSTKAYSTTGGSPLQANTWYRETGSNTAILTASNGIDITSVGLCTNCNCKELPYVEVYSPSDDAVLACCPEYNGEVKLWANAGGTGATAYWSDQFQITKYQPGATSFISDGKDVEQITVGGTASFFGSCTPTLCNDRTETFYITVENSLPTNTEITLDGLLSLDGVNSFYNGEFISTGNTFSFEYEAYYPVGSWFGAEITVPGAYSGYYFYQIYWNGEEVENGIQESGYTVPTALHGPLQPGDVFSITVQWNTA